MSSSRSTRGTTRRIAYSKLRFAGMWVALATQVLQERPRRREAGAPVARVEGAALGGGLGEPGVGDVFEDAFDRVAAEPGRELLVDGGDVGGEEDVVADLRERGPPALHPGRPVVVDVERGAVIDEVELV